MGFSTNESGCREAKQKICFIQWTLLKKYGIITNWISKLSIWKLWEVPQVQKIDATVKKETLFIAAFTLIFSAVMELVFLLLGYWSYKVVLGNLLGFTAAVLNFFLMGYTVQEAVLLEEKDAKKKVKLSQSLRTLMLVAFAAVGCVFKCFNPIAVLFPLLFPRIAILFRPLFKNND